MSGQQGLSAKKFVKQVFDKLVAHAWNFGYAMGLVLLAPPKPTEENGGSTDSLLVTRLLDVAPIAPIESQLKPNTRTSVRRKAMVVAHTPIGLPASDVRTKRSKAIRKSQGESEQLPTPYSSLYAGGNVTSLRSARSKSLKTKEEN